MVGIAPISDYVDSSLIEIIFSAIGVASLLSVLFRSAFRPLLDKTAQQHLPWEPLLSDPFVRRKRLSFIFGGKAAGEAGTEVSGWRPSKSASPRPSGRDPALDLVKGLLVLGMMAHHAGVSFIQNTPVRYFLLNRLLDFVSGGWVFVCGLIITTHYLPRFQTDARNVSLRLWVRGAKMVILFGLLNIFVVLLGIREPSQILDMTALTRVLIFGDGTVTSFGILLGIGYVLFISPSFLSFKRVGIVISLLVIGSATYFTRFGYNVPGNLWIVLCGLAGMTIGATLWPQFTRTINGNSGRRWPVIGIVFSAMAAYYLAGVYLDFDRNDLPVYLWGVTSIVAVFYISYSWFSSVPALSAWLQLLGRYSLISYLFQMSLFRLALNAESRLGVTLSYGLILLGVLFTVGVTIVFLDKEIHKRSVLQKSYQLIFG